MDFTSVLTSTAPAVAALLLILLCSVNVISSMKNKKKNLPPVAGTMFHQLLNFRRLHDYHADLCRRYKTFRILSPFNHQIYITDPANVEYILKTNFKNYGKGSFNYERLKELLGDGIFVVDGEKWKHQRKVASFEFSTRVLRDFSSSVFKVNAAKLTKMICKKANSFESMDIQDLFMRSTMDSIFKVGFGMEMNCLEGSDESSRFHEAFHNASELMSRRYVDAFWKVKKFLQIGYEVEFSRCIQIIDDFATKLIETKIKNLSNQANESKKEDLLTRFLSEMEKDPENVTKKYVKDIILNFLSAGKDTTAGTLSWFIYVLCKHPLIQEKVAQEVREAVETDDITDIDNFASLLTDEALDKMQYLHATLTETLRLYPSVPMDNKICFEDDTLPDGFNVCKGDMVNYLPYAMGRLKSLWGEDAETFRPERWINNEGFFQPESPFKFTAFQAGPRICLGKEFAYRQMKIFAAVLLGFLKFKLKNENEVIKFRTMITLHIDKGLHVHAFLRDN